MYTDPQSAAEQGEADTVQFPRGFAQPKPFALQPPPIKIQGATPKLAQVGFESPVRATSTSPPPPPPAPPLSPGFERRVDHVPAAPGEQQYAAVPIPGAYATPLASPAPVHAKPMGFDFGPGVQKQ